MSLDTPVALACGGRAAGFHVAELCAASVSAALAVHGPHPAEQQPAPADPSPAPLLCLRVLAALAESADGSALLADTPQTLQRGSATSARFAETADQRAGAVATLAAAAAGYFRGELATAPSGPAALSDEQQRRADVLAVILQTLAGAASRHAGASAALVESGALLNSNLIDHNSVTTGLSDTGRSPAARTYLSAAAGLLAVVEESCAAPQLATADPASSCAAVLLSEAALAFASSRECAGALAGGAAPASLRRACAELCERLRRAEGRAQEAHRRWELVVAPEEPDEPPPAPDAAAWCARRLQGASVSTFE